MSIMSDMAKNDAYYKGKKLIGCVFHRQGLKSLTGHWIELQWLTRCSGGRKNNSRNSTTRRQQRARRMAEPQDTKIVGCILTHTESPVKRS